MFKSSILYIFNNVECTYIAVIIIANLSAGKFGSFYHDFLVKLLKNIGFQRYGFQLGAGVRFIQTSVY